MYGELKHQPDALDSLRRLAIVEGVFILDIAQEKLFTTAAATHDARISLDVGFPMSKCISLHRAAKSPAPPSRS
jgi:hypothetical protein